MSSVSPAKLRQQYLVEYDVQMALLSRMFFYALGGTIYFVVMIVCSQWLSDPERPLGDVLIQSVSDTACWLPGFLLFTPLAAIDLLKTTNRAAGPIHRLRREMKSLIQNNSDRPLQFRDEDYWTDLAVSFNQIRGELLFLRRQVSEAQRATEAPAAGEDHAGAIVSAGCIEASDWSEIEPSSLFDPTLAVAGKSMGER